MRATPKIERTQVLVSVQVFGAKRTNLHQQYDSPRAQRRCHDNRPMALSPGNAGPPNGSEPTARWTLRLLGGFELSDGEQRYARLASRPVVALLARLALWPNRNHPREELVELLWPGVDPQISRNRLRQALSVLKSVLEPPSAVPAPVLEADRYDVRVVKGAIDCDVLAFDREARLGRAEVALALYRGELLPGYFDEWVLDERDRLQAVSERLEARVQSTVAARTAPPATGQPATSTATSATASDRIGQRAALPVYLTRHFMPDALRAAWLNEAASHRLLTLLGPGGSGKTRLAVELAHAVLASGRSETDPAPDGRGPSIAPIDGVAFVSLVACNTRARALDALAVALGVSGQSGDPVTELVSALSQRRLMLVLDNFEQLVDTAGDVVATLTGALPDLRIVVTSRRALGIDGERAVPVPPLDLPPIDLPLVLAASNPSVGLFIDRARQVRADFHLGESNRLPVLGLVRALEGLPLAIELAASRIRSLPAARILELLTADDAVAPRLELLSRTGPRSALDARHASMDRAIRWSWQLLSSDEASLMQALSVFSGGCSAAAAAAVRGLTPIQAALRIDALVANSMLRATEMPWGEMRFELYESIREFALTELRQAPLDGSEAAMRAAHRAWMLDWAEGLPTTPSLPAIRAEMANLSMALNTAGADGDPAIAIRTVLALCQVHDDVVLGPDSLASLERAVLRCDNAELRSRGHTQLAQLLFAAARGEAARRHAELGLEQVLDDPGLRARAMHVKARLHWLSVGYAPWLDAFIDEADALARAAQDLAVQARVTVLRAAIAYAYRRDMVLGESLYRAALALWERLGNQHAINGGRYFVALVVHEAKRHAEAIERADEVVLSAARLGDTRRVSQALQVRGKAEAALRRWPQAAASYREAVRLAWEGMAMVELGRALRDLPAALAHLRETESAVRLQAFAAGYWQAHIGHADPFDERQARRVRRLSAGRMTTSQWEAARRGAATMGLADAVALALRDTPVSVAPTRH
jgi:predicted ATPase